MATIFILFFFAIIGLFVHWLNEIRVVPWNVSLVICVVLYGACQFVGSSNESSVHHSKESTSPADYRTRSYLSELDEIERDLQYRQFSTDPADRDLSAVNARLKPIEEHVRSQVEKMNRKPWEPGYSLSQRKEAAYRTLLQRGDSPHEARLTVDAMEKQGLLPDPPRR